MRQFTAATQELEGLEGLLSDAYKQTLPKVREALQGNSVSGRSKFLRIFIRILHSAIWNKNERIVAIFYLYYRLLNAECRLKSSKNVSVEGSNDYGRYQESD